MKMNSLWLVCGHWTIIFTINPKFRLKNIGINQMRFSPDVFIYLVMNKNQKLRIMKKLLFTLFIAGLVSTFSYGQKKENKVIGYWLTEEGESQVHIFKDNGKFHGKIVWLEEPYEEDGTPKQDDENPKEKLRDRKILGLQLLKNFEYDEDDERWEDGKIYDAKSGNTYKCRMWFEDGYDKLYIKGYIGISVIGRTTKWTREANKRSL